jgi:hypothetical protein
MNDRIYKIIEVDYQKNHGGRKYSAEDAKKTFDDYVKGGGKHMEFGNVLIMYEPREDGVLEFHCINAGGANELIDAVNKILKMAKGRFLTAATYYDNPKLNEFAGKMFFPSYAKKIDQGEDRTYEMTFDLRR